MDLVKTAEFDLVAALFSHHYAPKAILKRLGVDGRTLIVGSKVKAERGRVSGWIRYIPLFGRVFKPKVM